jgi:hypothetical protein
MKTYYETESGIDTGDFLVPVDHPYYAVIAKEIENNEAEVKPVEKLTAQQTWRSVREKRNQMLMESDWTALPDAAVAKKTEWMTYRMLLRQIPQMYTNPAKIVWPTSP